MSGFNIQLILMAVIFAAGGDFFATTSAAGFYCDNFRLSNGFNVHYPFHIINSDDGRGRQCGYPGFGIDLDENLKTIINISNSLYYVLSFDTDLRSIRLASKDIVDEECPRPTQNLTRQVASPFFAVHDDFFTPDLIYFYNCSNYPGELSCLDTYYNVNTSVGGLRSFAQVNFMDDVFNRSRSCQEIVVVPFVDGGGNYSDVKGILKSGFDLYWSTPDECKKCERSGGHCHTNQTSGVPPLCSCHNDTRLYHGSCPQGLSVGLKITTGVCVGISGLLLVILLIYRKKCSLVCRSSISRLKAIIKTPTNVEVFLESGGCFGLQRYSYSEIKEMTNSFKKTLGQGGFGSVFKGKLPDGRLVAIKVLNESKGNGEDFINEVATIGRTNHVNVVRILGFCSSGTKRALVYEFMPNGSLEKFIYDGNNKSMIKPSLGREKLYQITLGIARGLEYLHRGCNIRILHFDIKPHNILLDEDFCPKISDFGLAKLCVAKESIVSMHVARGTMGYIAPEVCLRNFGKVSHKSDVYSFGMMTLEMIGGRKNIDATIENTSAIYFPQWIYNHLKEDFSMEEFEERYKEETTKKMIIVALWCIQTRPSDRPSISKIVEMLEGNVDDLQMPPDPFHSSPCESASP